MKKLVVFVLLVAGLLPKQSEAGKKLGVDLVSGSVGTWTALKDESTGADSKDSYFNTAKISIYYHVGKIKGFAGVPATLVLERYPTEIKWAFYPSDFSAYWGLKAGPVEPRVGITFPMGYPTDADIAWTGSGNVKGILGLGFGLGKTPSGRVSFGGEFMSRIYLTGLADEVLDSTGTIDKAKTREAGYARIDRGSFGWYLSIKGTYKASDKAKIGLELFPHGSYFTTSEWDRWNKTKSFLSFGILPILFFSYAPASRVELSAKAGYGVTNTGSRIIHAVISTTVYTW